MWNFPQIYIVEKQSQPPLYTFWFETAAVWSNYWWVVCIKSHCEATQPCVTSVLRMAHSRVDWLNTSTSRSTRRQAIASYMRRWTNSDTMNGRSRNWRKCRDTADTTLNDNTSKHIWVRMAAWICGFRVAQQRNDGESLTRTTAKRFCRSKRPRKIAWGPRESTIARFVRLHSALQVSIGCTARALDTERRQRLSSWVPGADLQKKDWLRQEKLAHVCIEIIFFFSFFEGADLPVV